MSVVKVYLRNISSIGIIIDTLETNKHNIEHTILEAVAKQADNLVMLCRYMCSETVKTIGRKDMNNDNEQKFAFANLPT